MSEVDKNDRSSVESAARHLDRGRALCDLGRFDEALPEFQQAVSGDPSSAQAHGLLGNALFLQGDTHSALAVFRRAVALDPNSAGGYFDAGRALDVLREYAEAEACYRRALQFDPSLDRAREALGRMLHSIGRVADAETVFRDWLLASENNPVALHMLAACSGQNIADRASDDYVRTTFDRFAAQFDATLEKLDYRAPWLIEAALAAIRQRDSSLAVLDAGCGTGLCGPLLRPFARRLVGVDLSEQMLIRAARRGCYDELQAAELTAYLLGQPAAFDLIASADTLVYFGELGPVLAAARAAAAPGGLLLFTVECLRENEDGQRFRLNPHGRYSHTRSYVEAALTATCWAICSIEPDTLRWENGATVEGLVVVARPSQHAINPSASQPPSLC